MNGGEITGSFYEKELQTSNQEKFRIRKVLKKKVLNCTSNGKGIIIILIVGLIKKTMKKNFINENLKWNLINKIL